jgi:3-oxoacyl-[acyl-carrier protein] reductase
MDLGLRGKVALVTGANRGIGLAIAMGLAREGCALAICARSRDTLAAAAERIEALGVRVAAIPADVLLPADAQRFVEEAAAQLGGIDILVNNAGKNVGWRLAEATDEDWRQTFDYNVFQAARLVRLVVPHMRQRGGGAVVMVSSISGWVPQLAGTGQYGASKAAQIFMAEPLALELVPDRIRVNVVSPGSILFEASRQEDSSPAPYAFLHEPAGRPGTASCGQRRRGSSASRSASPTRLKPSTARTMAVPGTRERCGELRR